jgi:tetratricopeptide (TPR) repeat protein
VTFLAINRLAEREIIAMIEGVIGNKALPADIRQDIIERADGIPLFVEEMTKAVLEAGSEGTAQRTAAAVPSPTLAVPASLQASLMARLDRLGPAKDVGQIGAAIGREFSHALISALVMKPEPELLLALDRLIAAGLLFRQGVPPHASYLFKHALVQDAAYSSFLRKHRQQLHARIAETLETRFPELVSTQPQVLAHHWTEANLTEKAIGYLLKAGQQALLRSAMAEAVAQLKKGLSLLNAMPGGMREHKQHELELRIALGPALIATRGYSSSEVGEALAEASALAEQMDRPDCLIPLLYGRWAYHAVRAEHRLAMLLAEKMEKLNNGGDDVGALLFGPFLHGINHHQLGEFAAARALFERCQGLRAPALRRTLSKLAPQDAYAVMLLYLGISLAHLGYFDQAWRWANEGLSEARQLRHAYTLAFCLLYMCWVATLANEPRKTRQYAEEILTLANEHGFPFFSAYGTVWLGCSATAVGEAGDGVRLLTEGMSLLQANGAAAGTALHLAFLAEGYAGLGQLADGMSRLDEAAQFIQASDERNHEAEVYRVRGDLLCVTGERVAAEENYRRALAITRQQSARVFELRAAICLARLWRDQGRRDEARELLAPVYGWFTEGFDMLDLKEAKGLLEELK